MDFCYVRSVNLCETDLLASRAFHCFSNIDSRPVLAAGLGSLPLNQQHGPSGQCVRLSKVKAIQPCVELSASQAALQSCHDVMEASLPWLSPWMSVSM